MNGARCPVCREDRLSVQGPYRCASTVFAGCARTLCETCGMVFASPMPDEAAVTAYNASYFDSAHGGAPADRVTLAYHSAINLLRVAHVERYLGRREHSASRVLEAGAGGGHFARHWLSRHPGAVYHAVESDASCHAALRELGVRLHARGDEIPDDAVFDLVVMSHVLEHTTDPFAFLDTMTRRLRKGGVIFIEVPCRDWEFKRQDEPHLLFFDKAPLAHLLGKAGFADLEITYHGREIAALRAPSFAARVWERVRAHLLARGIVAPFASSARGLDDLPGALERAAVAPFKAHIEQQRPSGWLRAAGMKL